MVTVVPAITPRADRFSHRHGDPADWWAMVESAALIVALGLALAQPVPQVLRLRRTGHTDGISPTAMWLGVGINLIWIGYCVARDLPAVAAVSAVYLAGYGAIVALLVAHGRRRGVRYAVAAVAAAGALQLAGGWGLVGTALGLAVGIQYLPQVVAAWRSPSLAGLAPGMYLVTLLDGAVWGLFGLLEDDRPLVLYGAIMLTVSVAVLAAWLRWRRVDALLLSANPAIAAAVEPA